MTTTGKVFTWIGVILTIALSVFLYFKFWFVYAQGVNEGDINYFQKEGFVFKTYEGRMIQTGYNSKGTGSTIQSNELKFSVADERVAEQINNSSMRGVKLHWSKYLGALPWRGNERYVVDSIVSVQQSSLGDEMPPVLVE